MADTRELLRTLEQGGYDAALAALYAPDGDKKRLACARERAMRMVRALEDNFTARDGAALFTAPGRTELGGNHTDHQHGRVLCGSVDLDMLAQG